MTTQEKFNELMLDSIKKIIEQMEANKNNPTEIVSCITYQMAVGMDETNEQESEMIYNLILQRYSRIIKNKNKTIETK